MNTTETLSEIQPLELTYVKEIMQMDVKTARPDPTVKEVVEKMNHFNIGSIVIVEKMRSVDIITERDVLQRVGEDCIDPSICKAKEVMTTPIVNATEDMPVGDAINLMKSRRIKKIPALRKQSLVGIVTTTDLLDKSPALLRLRRRPRAGHGD